MVLAASGASEDRQAIDLNANVGNFFVVSGKYQVELLAAFVAGISLNETRLGDEVFNVHRL